MFTIVSVTSKRLNFDIHWFSKYSYWMANHRPETLLSASLCVTVSVLFSVARFCIFSLVLMDGCMDEWMYGWMAGVTFICWILITWTIYTYRTMHTKKQSMNKLEEKGKRKRGQKVRQVQKKRSTHYIT